jgi:hypothetical protein
MALAARGARDRCSPQNATRDSSIWSAAIPTRAPSTPKCTAKSSFSPELYVPKPEGLRYAIFAFRYDILSYPTRIARGIVIQSSLRPERWFVLTALLPLTNNGAHGGVAAELARTN